MEKDGRALLSLSLARGRPRICGAPQGAAKAKPGEVLKEAEHASSRWHRARRWGQAGGIMLAFSVALAPGLAAAAEGPAPSEAAGLHGRQEIPEAGPSGAASFVLRVQGDSVSAAIANIPFRQVLAQLATQLNIKLFVADTVPDDEFSDEFEDLPLEGAIKRLLVGKSYALRYAQPSHEKPAKAGSQPKITAIYVMLQGSGAVTPYRLEQVGKPQPQTDEQLLLKKALEAEQAADRVEALKKYLNETEEPDYEAAAAALKDKDPKVREIALGGMEEADTLPAEATAQAALTDPEPALRINALQILVTRQGDDAQETITQAMVDADPRVRANAQEMAKLAERVEALRAEREAEAANAE